MNNANCSTVLSPQPYICIFSGLSASKEHICASLFSSFWSASKFNVTRTSARHTVLPDQRRAFFHVHLWGIVSLWKASWSSMKEIIINWTWDVVAGRRKVITISITLEMDSMYSLVSCLLKKEQALLTEVNVDFCGLQSLYDYPLSKHVFSSPGLYTFTGTPVITTWDWLFDCFQRVSAKSLFCDYCLIICPLSGTVAGFRRLGLSDSWAFDWQLVNDVISILCCKANSAAATVDWSTGGHNLL